MPLTGDTDDLNKVLTREPSYSKQIKNTVASNAINRELPEAQAIFPTLWFSGLSWMRSDQRKTCPHR